MAVLTPHDTIKVYLPYPVKIMCVTVHIKHETGFSFTNMAMYLFRDANNMKTSADFKAWMEKNTETSLVNEMVYFAYVSYCQLNKKKEQFTKEQVQKAIILADLVTRERVIQCFAKSETFGTSKKKVNPKEKMK